MRAVAVSPMTAVVTCVTTFFALDGPAGCGASLPQVPVSDMFQDSGMFLKQGGIIVTGKGFLVGIIRVQQYSLFFPSSDFGPSLSSCLLAAPLESLHELLH